MIRAWSLALTPLVLVSALAIFPALTLIPARAGAEDAIQEGVDPAGATEEPDATRLDVERLPPEAIPITRDLYAHGFFLEATIGGRGWLGGAGRLMSPGPYASVGFGYEFFDWLYVSGIGEMSIHETSAPAPPSTTVFELLSALGEVKLQLSPTPELGLWAAGDVGLIVASTDLLALYGFQQAATVGFQWGADIGVDAHFHSRHYSIGLRGGIRGAPSLDGPDGEIALGAHAAAYLRYVF